MKFFILKGMKNAALCCLCFCLVACSVDENIDILEKKDLKSDYRISEVVAKATVLNFLDEIESIAVRKVSPTIKGVECITAADLITQTSSVVDTTSTDTLFYAFDLAEGGFVLASADSRTSPIYAYVEKGTFSTFSTSSNEDKISPELFKSVYDFELKNQSGPLEGEPVIGYGRTKPDYADFCSKRLKTQWAQGGAYNAYCPSGSPTGCVPTAAAQILSYFPVIDKVEWTDGDKKYTCSLNWERIMREMERNNGIVNLFVTKETRDEVAHLMRYIGAELGAKYGKEVTGVSDPKAPKNFFRRIGLTASSVTDYKSGTAINWLKEGKLIMMFGYKHWNLKGWQKGHCWVIDGYSVGRKDGKEYELLHCNWGWGDSNGFFLSKLFDSAQPVDVDAEGRPKVKHYYKRNLEMIAVGKN